MLYFTEYQIMKYFWIINEQRSSSKQNEIMKLGKKSAVIEIFRLIFLIYRGKYKKEMFKIYVW